MLCRCPVSSGTRLPDKIILFVIPRDYSVNIRRTHLHTNLRGYHSQRETSLNPQPSKMSSSIPQTVALEGRAAAAAAAADDSDQQTLPASQPASQDDEEKRAQQLAEKTGHATEQQLGQLELGTDGTAESQGTESSTGNRNTPRPLDRWNETPTHAFRFLATLWCFVVMGINDACFGVSLAYRCVVSRGCCSPLSSLRSLGTC